MKKVILSVVTLSLLLLPLSTYATDINCQTKPVVDGIEESELQNWQSWQLTSSMDADLAGTGTVQTISIINNKATNEWGVFIDQGGEKTLLYATKTTKPLQLTTVTTDNILSLQIINPETKQLYKVSYKAPQDFTICLESQAANRSHYKCTGIGEIHPMPDEPDVGDGTFFKIDLDEDGVQETLTTKIQPAGRSVLWVITVNSTVVYNGALGHGATYMNPYALNGGKPVIHFVTMDGSTVKDAVEINYLGAGKFTTCPISNGKQILTAAGIRY